MKPTLTVIGRVAISVGLIFVILTYTIWDMPFVAEVREFNEQFELVRLGDSENTVRSILGTPDAIEQDFRLGQQKGFEEAYARAEASGSERYFLYFRGIDVVYSVGLDNNGKVRAKEYGGT